MGALVYQVTSLVPPPPPFWQLWRLGKPSLCAVLRLCVQVVSQAPGSFAANVTTTIYLHYPSSVHRSMLLNAPAPPSSISGATARRLLSPAHANMGDSSPGQGQARRLLQAGSDGQDGLQAVLELVGSTLAAEFGTAAVTSSMAGAATDWMQVQYGGCPGLAT